MSSTYACCEHCSRRPHEDHSTGHLTPCSATCDGSREVAQGLREGATSETDGESGTELRPCDSAALTWLEIGAATREGIAKEIETAMRYEGVRARRVMAMCAYIARTWKP